MGRKKERNNELEVPTIKINKWFDYEKNAGWDKIKPLFMWAGGKNKMLKHYKEYIDIQYKNYCEPFVGGGALFLYAMKNTFVTDRIVINDINVSIINIYLTIKNNVQTFVNKMDILENAYIPLDYENRKEFYLSLRYEHAYNYEKWDKISEAVALYFLMKTGFNGLWQTNENTNNRFGTHCGLLNEINNVYDKDNIFLWNKLLNKKNVEIYSEDWKDCAKRVEDDNTFFFLDPPYRGGFTKYEEKFNDGEQRKLIEFCKSLKTSTVLLSNRDMGDGFFEKEKGNLKIKKFPITYTLGRRKKTENGFEAKPATEILLVKNKS